MELRKAQSDEDVLAPFRDLDPSRLAVHGTGCLGHYRLSFWLPGDAVSEILICLNCDVLAWPSTIYAWSQRRRWQILRRLWGSHDLLMFHSEEVRADRSGKNLQLLQVGRVRQANWWSSWGQQFGIHDYRVPSRELPSSSDLFDIAVCPVQSKVGRISITDRKDFYHQISATKAKGCFQYRGAGHSYSDGGRWPSFYSFLFGAEQDVVTAELSRVISFSSGRNAVVGDLLKT